MERKISVVELIRKIKERPVMYIGRNSIFCLRSFLQGICWMNPNVHDASILTEFQDWVVDKYRIKTSHSWDNIIHFYSQDECDALKIFFLEFDAFLIDKKNHGSLK